MLQVNSRGRHLTKPEIHFLNDVKWKLKKISSIKVPAISKMKAKIMAKLVV